MTPNRAALDAETGPEVDLSGLARSGRGPLVTAVVPTYGDADYVGPALESVAAQTYGNVEAVVVDGSGVDWLESAADDIGGLAYVYQEPRGLAAARNRGIDESAGDIVGFLDADDRWHPGKLARQVAAIHDGADVVYSDVRVVTEGGESHVQSSLPVEDSDRHHVDFLYEGGVPIPTVVARRECLTAERFDEDLPAVEDRNLLARLFARFEPARVAEPLADYRRRADSMSSDAETMYRSELANLDHLARELPGVGPHRDALAALAAYKHGKRLLRAGRAGEARPMLRRVVLESPRTWRPLALFALALTPVDHRNALRRLERLQERFRRAVASDGRHG